MVGMATTLTECSLAQLYKRKDASGQFYGNPAFYIQHRLKKQSSAGQRIYRRPQSALTTHNSSTRVV